MLYKMVLLIQKYKKGAGVKKTQYADISTVFFYLHTPPTP